MKAAILLIAAALAAPSPVAAQSPLPGMVEQRLCVTFHHTPGTVISPTTLAADLAAGTVIVTIVQSEEMCAPVPDPSEEPFVGEDTTDGYFAFLLREQSALQEAVDLMQAFSDSSDKNTYKTAHAVETHAKKEVAWLDDNQPDDCYADLWQSTRDVWAMMRKGYGDFAYGWKHDNLARLSRSTDEIGEATDLLDLVDYDSETCDS